MTSELERRMRRFLEAHHHHFQLALVLVSRLGWREEAESWAEAYCREKGIDFHRIDGSRMDPGTLIRHIIAHQGQAGLFVLTGLDGALSHRETRLADLLNRQRERIGRSLKGPVLWIIGETAFDRLLQDAPDLADWRSAMFVWESAVAPAELDRSALQISILTGAPLTRGSLQRRADLLRGQFSRAESEKERTSIALDLTRILLQAGDWREALLAVGAALGSPDPHESLRARLYEAELLAATGELEKAAVSAQRALALSIEQEDPRSRASAFGILADVLQMRGNLDEAVRIRRDEVIPGYEQVGDLRARAVTLGKLADVFELRGELDEALSIRLEEELPVYKEVGDLRAHAITLGKVADLLHMRGELDEALSIRKEGVLPAFEAVGDLRSRAVTLGKIADILELRGELDEALRIRRDEELALYEKIGDIHACAVTRAKIADVLRERGELEEALLILRNDALPVFESLSDPRWCALTHRRIANIRARQGATDEAIFICERDVLPAFERLRQEIPLAHARRQLADHLLKRNRLEDRKRARDLLTQAIATARRLNLPLASEIEGEYAAVLSSRQIEDSSHQA